MIYQKTEHISAGRFKLGKEQSDIYQACLGTCLGVALYDKSTKIGGMIHILLPEPHPISKVEFPEKYASTGVPMLISELKKMGARAENLKASIAGGALVGPVSLMDINLDIGGRSAEITASILEASGIKIIKSETGGFFTCTLELDMTTGRTSIDPGWEEIDRTQSNFTAPSLKDIFNTIDQLQPIPQTALKIFRMFQSPGHHITDITDELLRDQVLAGQTLKLCNSALFSGMVKIETLKDAVLVLGEEMLLNSVITAAVDAYFNQTGTSGYSLCKGGLFFHAVGVASTAEKIARKSGRGPLKLAYTAGLLHDIGKVILDQFIADYSPLFFRKLGQNNEDFLNAEKKILGITHCEAGALLAKKWNFSSGLTQVIQYHHAPEKVKENKDLAYIVYLSDLLMERFNAGLELEKMQTKNFESALTHLGIAMADLPELVDAIPSSAFNNDDI